MRILRCSGSTRVICDRLPDPMSLRKLSLDSFPQPRGTFPMHRCPSWKFQLPGVNVLTYTLPLGEYSEVFGTCRGLVFSCFVAAQVVVDSHFPPHGPLFSRYTLPLLDQGVCFGEGKHTYLPYLGSSQCTCGAGARQTLQVARNSKVVGESGPVLAFTLA